MSNNMSSEVSKALDIIWDDYFSSDIQREDAIKMFTDDLNCHLVGSTLCDIFRQKILDNKLLTIG